MRFYRFLLALFLLLFTGEFCVGQSWDWVIGQKDPWSNDIYITNEGDVYTTQFAGSIKFSSADTLTYTNEILTKYNKAGKRIGGFNIIHDDFTPLNTTTKMVQVQNGFVYVLLTVINDVKIGASHYPKPSPKHGKANLILLIADTSCTIKKSRLLGWVNKGSPTSLRVSKDDNLYISIEHKDSLFISNKLFLTNSKIASRILKLDNKGNLSWETEVNNTGYRASIDNYGNYWTELKYVIGTGFITKYLKISPSGNIIDSLILNGRLQSSHLKFDTDNNILITGHASGDFTFQDGSSKKNLAYTGILLKYDEKLKLQWYRIASTTNSNLNEITTDKLGNIYILGFTESISAFDSIGKFEIGGLTVVNVPKNIYILKLNKNGKGIWVKYIDLKSGYGRADKIYADNCENIYVKGGFSNGGNSIPLIEAIGEHSILVEPNTNVPFIAKLNPAKLEFEPNVGCEIITLKNTSDTTAYTSIEWTMPDNTKHFSRDAYIETNKYSDTVLVSLKGIKASGCENIFTRKLKFKEMPKPVAKFSIDSFSGCQWVGIKFYNESYKTVEPGCLDCEGYLWDFGDGTIKGESDLMKMAEHIYTKPGTYKISLIYTTIPCQDTFTLEKQITIIEAPKPGFTVDKKEGCAPLTVNITNQSIGQVDTYLYTSGDGQTSNQPSPVFIYTKPGKYFIKQYLKGPTECITKDSLEITIRAGYNQSADPEILTATVTDSNFVKVSWKKNDVTANYKLIRQSINNTQTFQFQSSDILYVDKDVDVNKAFYSYILYGTDSCENTKQASKAQTILLANHSQTTEYNYLRWSPYQYWKNGVTEYKLYFKTDSHFVELSTFSGNVNEYKDAKLYPAETKQICYKIIATENGGNKQQSQSNTVCMHFLPTIIIPNAFSPNNDSLNEIFSFSQIGIESYELSIYNRWGEKIYTGTEKDKGWDGRFKNALSPEGIYLYKLKAKPYNGKNIYQSGNLQLLR